MYRQGDVLIIRASTGQNPGKPRPRDDGGRVILALGEVTGHAHAIADREAELFDLDDSEDAFLRVLADGGVDLVHEEHATITIPTGEWIVRRQVEAWDAEARQVAD